jgi:hypothetical protein
LKARKTKERRRDNEPIYIQEARILRTRTHALAHSLGDGGGYCFGFALRANQESNVERSLLGLAPFS